jgi:hypothetical protein
MKLTIRKGMLLLMLSGLLVQCGGGNVKNLSRSIPDSVLGWGVSEEDVTYDRETLYGYMNGGAEVYLAFDFQQVFVRRYSQGGDDEIVLDIYDMGSPPEAFGVFSCDREDEEAGIGQGSEYGYGMLRFWKGRYFVTIMTSGDYEAAEGAILELGRAVDGVLGPEGDEPELLGQLPEDGLLSDRISYFHSNINLNNRFFIASENILGLDRDTECAFAEYSTDDVETMKLLVVKYPDEERAEQAYGSFRSVYLPDSEGPGPAQMEDGKYTCPMQLRETIAIVFDAPDEETAWRMCNIWNVQIGR